MGGRKSEINVHAKRKRGKKKIKAERHGGKVGKKEGRTGRKEKRE